ncbi:hypothetical protein D0868_09427 [Hortaea werneckii]|uniref:Cyanovirin-N domain-containing protein n=1 Tax=Hortaea werneckii TaxID=91943 RepID=A0A3M6Y9E7_HORWE|nr:hypothetical protein D0868_09427 [Hortaea werneckii]
MATMRLLTIGRDKHGRSIHVLDDGLGNRDGIFTTPGRDFSFSARDIRLSLSVLSAQLRTVAGHWKADAIKVQSRCNCDATGCTHELILGAPDEVAAGHIVHASIFDLGYRCQDIRLEGASRLRAKCLFEPPYDFQESEISLDSVLGTSNGTFCFGSNFSASARNVHLKNTTLYAELRAVSGDWQAREVELRRLVCNVGRGLQSLDTRRSLRVPSPLPAVVAKSCEEGISNELFTPLKTNEACRLLYIEPGEFDDPIRCRMATRQASDRDEYMCLSYVWGDTSEAVMIHLNSHPKLVTRNLHSALQRLRSHGYLAALWVDALCINQDDKEEKSLQVARMAKTYAEAQRVFVWLCDGPLNGPFEFLNEIVTAFFHDLLSNSHVHQAMEKSSSHEIDLARTYNLTATLLGELAKSSWFQRTWTIKEDVLARETVFGFGSQLLNEKLLEIALGRMTWHLDTCCRGILDHVETGFQQRIGSLEFPLSRLQQRFELQRFLKLISKDAREASQEPQETPTLLRHTVDNTLLSLHECRRRGCSDPRDRVYALTDMTSPAPVAFKPDYTASVEEVYKAFTLRTIERVGNLDIWSLIQPPKDSTHGGVSGLPSWAVDWTVDSEHACILSNFTLTFEMLTPPLPITLPGPLYELVSDDILRIHGTKFDDIQAISSNSWPMRSRSNRKMGDSVLQDWLHFLGIPRQARSPSTVLLWDSFRDLMMPDQVLLYTAHEDIVATPMMDKGRIWQGLNQADKDRFDTYVISVQEMTDHASGVEIPDRLVPVRRTVDRFASTKNLFRTTEGRIGLCGKWVRPGDELYHISGSRWPVVLRRHPRADFQPPEPARFQLVGTCYMRGLSQDLVESALQRASKIHIK